MSRFLTYLLVALATVLAYGCCMQETGIVDSPSQQKAFHAMGHTTVANQVPDMIEEVDVEETVKPAINILPVIIASIAPYTPTCFPVTIERIDGCHCPVFIFQHKLLI
ncbi:hypothetical protein [Chryseolinea soli]|uniref:Uncharacterized protein n=1 Tax=Chryseolinea soli TaxID=2321403 RepID=A0A385SSD3_9BACT|nr:hypothetical protein [Chryseolinea soli]AYB32580.1 hypothetical protein D4L85_19250 [Chryseolinea soli]